MGIIIKEFTSFMNTSLFNLKMTTAYTFQVEVEPELVYHFVGKRVGNKGNWNVHRIYDLQIMIY